MSSELSEILANAVQAMRSSDPARAHDALRRLSGRIREAGSNGIDLTEASSAFKTLLRKRGYFVSTPEEVTASLNEIRGVGEGFDLFELARLLDETDRTLAECLGVHPRRILGELAGFSPPCTCEVHSEAEPHR